MVTITVIISALSLHYFGAQPSGILRSKPEGVMHWLPIVLRIHIAGGMLAMASGAALVYTSRQRSRHRTHRWLGRGYSISVLISGLMGAVIAPYAFGGLISGLGFLGMTTAWLYFSTRTIYLAVKGDLSGHQKAATYSLAMTYTALTFRMFLLIPLLTSLPFLPVYRFGSWAAWLINLGLAAWWLSRQSHTNSSINKLELS